MEGRGDELGAVEGCDVDLDNCGGGDRGGDIRGLCESSSSRRVGIRRDFNDEVILAFLGGPVVSSSARRPSRGDGIVVLGSRVSCKPPLLGGGVNGTGVDELSDELRLVSCDEPLSILGETRVGSDGWF